MSGAGNLAASRRVREERWTYKQFPMAAVHVFQGGAAVFDTATGFLTKAGAATGLKVIGTFAEDKDNSAGAAGALMVNVKLLREVVVVRFVNGTSGDAIANANRGALAYFLDDESVSIVSTAHSAAGLIWDVDATKGVAIELGAS